MYKVVREEIGGHSTTVFLKSIEEVARFSHMSPYAVRQLLKGEGQCSYVQITKVK